MILLEENWDKIRQRVVLPLWNKKFKIMYENAKLDYDDFESLAGFELSKAMKTFNPQMSNLFTYATKVISQKALTELRNCTQRDKRKVLHIAENIETLDVNLYIIPNGIDEKSFDKDVLSDKMTAYLGRLSSLQKQVLFAMSDGYTNDEIKNILNISTKELTDAHVALKSHRNVSLLY